MKKFKRGNIIKLNKIGKGENKEIGNSLFEIESINDIINCNHYEKGRCITIKRKAIECDVKKGYAVYFTNGRPRCSEVLELATDREAFLYHVAGLREALE